MIRRALAGQRPSSRADATAETAAETVTRVSPGKPAREHPADVPAGVELTHRNYRVLDPVSVQRSLDQLDHRRFGHARSPTLPCSEWPEPTAGRRSDPAI
jgi:hypothetical protein